MDELLWQEIYSLREQLKIALTIIEGYDPDCSCLGRLRHRLYSVDYAQLMEELQDTTEET